MKVYDAAADINTASEHDKQCTLLTKVPRELRDMIYEYALYDADGFLYCSRLWRTVKDAGRVVAKFSPALLHTCKQIREEAATVAYKINKLTILISPTGHFGVRSDEVFLNDLEDFLKLDAPRQMLRLVPVVQIEYVFEWEFLVPLFGRPKNKLMRLKEATCHFSSATVSVDIIVADLNGAQIALVALVDAAELKVFSPRLTINIPTQNSEYLKDYMCRLHSIVKTIRQGYCESVIFTEEEEEGTNQHTF